MRRAALLALALVLAGFNLRIAVASVPPLLDDLERDPGLSSTLAGLLTAAPVLCFGLGAFAAAPLGRRLGGEHALVAALVAVCVGTFLRAEGSTAALFGGTIVAGGGVALANVLVPTIIRGRFPEHVGPLMGAYTSILGVGAALAGGLAVPLEHAFGWQSSLAVWAIPAAFAIAVAAGAFRLAHGGAGIRGGVGDLRSLLRNRLAWSVTVFFGVQSALFYSGLTWLPSILSDHGYSDTTSGAMLSVFAVVGIPASLFTPVVGARIRDQRAILCVFTVVELVGIAGLIVAPGAAVAWVVLYALGQGGAFSMALTLMVLRAPNARRAAELSGMAQAIGYALAALGPLIVGVLHDVANGWTVPLVFLLALGVPMLVAAAEAGRPRFVPA